MAYWIANPAFFAIAGSPNGKGPFKISFAYEKVWYKNEIAIAFSPNGKGPFKISFAYQYAKSESAPIAERHDCFVSARGAGCAACCVSSCAFA